MQHTDKVTMLETVAAAWNQAGITYAVAHGIDGYPATVGRDLDVLVRADQVVAGLAVAERVLVAHGWTVVHPPPLWGARLLAVHNADWDDEWIEIHTQTQLSWRNVRLVNALRPSEYWGPFKVDPWVSFSKRILGQVLDGNIRRFMEDRPHEWTLYEGERDVVPPVLSSLCGAELAQQLCEALVVGDPSLAAPLVPRLRHACMARACVKAPTTSLRLLRNSVRKKLVRPWAAFMPVVTLVGPDGVGKSTILRSVATSHSFVGGVAVRHWRSNMLPRLGSLIGAPALVPGPDGLPAPRHGAGRFHWLRLCYYLLEYAVGHIRDLIESSQQQLVLYDGYVLDMLVDPLRFGLQEGRATLLLKHLTPKPDLVVLLYDTLDRICARKPELAPSDIQQQLQRWLQFADEGKVDAVVSVDAPPEQVAARVKALILGALIAKNGAPALATASQGRLAAAEKSP